MLPVGEVVALPPIVKVPEVYSLVEEAFAKVVLPDTVRVVGVRLEALKLVALKLVAKK